MWALVARAAVAAVLSEKVLIRIIEAVRPTVSSEVHACCAELERRLELLELRTSAIALAVHPVQEEEA